MLLVSIKKKKSSLEIVFNQAVTLLMYALWVQIGDMLLLPLKLMQKSPLASFSIGLAVMFENLALTLFDLS